MRTFMLTAAAILSPVWAASLHAGEAAKESAAVEAVKKRLDELKGDGASVKLIDPKGTAAVPGYTFVAAYFPLFPVARVPAEPLSAQNLFAVDKDGGISHFPTPAALEKFFTTRIGVVKDPVKVASCYGHLAEVFFQDGFFKFQVDNESIKKTIRTIGKDDLPVIIGKVNVVPEGGNKGYFLFDFVLDNKEQIAKILLDNKVLAGVRPRCQATRLLDADPAIRDICERDLLVMGRLAHDYLMQQRAAASPELQRAIDRVWQRIVEEGR